MDLVSVRQQNQARKIQKRVFFTGNGALQLGVGLCYDRIVASQFTPDMPPAQSGVAGTTATQLQECRDNIVSLPATANRGNFAGVTDNAYAAVTGGQWITINEPGSVCQIAVNDATTINVTQLGCCVNGDPGVFTPGGLDGRGAAIAFQTTLTASTTSGNGPISKSLDGTATYTASTKVLVKTGAFTNAVVGDNVVVVGGALAADGTKPVNLGSVTIAVKTDNNTVTLSSDICSTNGAATAVVAFFVVRGNRPTVLAKLLDGGRESGCIDYYQPTSGGSATLDINGYTFIQGGGITLAADDTPGLAVNTIMGRQRGFELLGGGAITTSEVIITPTTSTAIQRNGTSTLAGIEIGESTELQCVLEWSGKKWSVQHLVGAVQS